MSWQCATLKANPAARRRTENPSVGVYPPVSAEGWGGEGGAYGEYGVGDEAGGGEGWYFGSSPQ